MVEACDTLLILRSRHFHFLHPLYLIQINCVGLETRFELFEHKMCYGLLILLSGDGRYLRGLIESDNN